jgi:hypothetical protein
VQEHEALSLGKTLKSYVWWTHERGSVHYDVMVTLILAFIFLTPHWIDFGDQPKPNLPANQIRASVTPDGTVYEVPVELIQPAKSAPTAESLSQALAPAAGPLSIDRWEAEREVGGRIIAWKVWAHRPGQ